MKTAPRRDAVNGGDDRLVGQQDLAVNITGGAEPGFDIGNLHAARLVQIHSGAKGALSRAGQNNAPHPIIAIEFNQAGGDAARQGQGQGVQVIGPVKAQDGDLARALHLYNVSHRSGL